MPPKTTGKQCLSTLWTLFQPPVTSFSQLPLYILSAIFQELDVVDFVHLGMPATPPLASFSTEDIKAFVIGRMKLLRRFNDGNKNLGFAAQSTTEIPGLCDLVLPPGGRSLLATSDEGDAVTLHRIGLNDGHASFPVAANIRLGGRPECTFVWNKLLVTMSPCPLLICFRGDGASSTIWIIKIDHHGYAMNLETTPHLSSGGSPPGKVDGPGLVIGFLVQRSYSEPSRVVVIHLDYPGVTVEADIPCTYAHTGVGRVSDYYSFKFVSFHRHDAGL